MREGSTNGNWKGGITSIYNADEILGLGAGYQKEIKRRLLGQYVVSKKTGCWNWTGSTFKKNNRARISIGKYGMLAARVCYVLFKGPIGTSLVCHSCDNPLCVNPEHLWLGSPQDNSDDSKRKGRTATGDRNGSRLYPERLTQKGDNHINRIDPTRVQGENNGRAILNEKQVREIRRKYIPGNGRGRVSNIKALQAEYGVSRVIIYGVVKWLTWKHVK